MDKEEARFILRCFRPDGADAENPDFAEALGWAAKDRELGEWLAHERASDGAFAQALGELTLPEALREEILAALALERGEQEIPADALDVAAISALAAVAPPSNLRREVLSAMARTVRPKKPWWSGWRLGLPLAAAAGIVVAFELSSSKTQRTTDEVVENAAPLPPQRGVAVPASTTLTIGMVERNSIRTLESPSFPSDLAQGHDLAPFDRVNDGALPCPSGNLPEGLRGAAGVGCHDLSIDGKKGVLVCYKDQGKMVHLVVFKRCDVICKLPKLDHPDFGQDGKWVVARWADENWVYMLLGGDGVAQEGLEKLF
jgi:predicted outer membrane lipoprotein